jgi:tetratricopeptide (TPR) repeat protein
MAAAWAAQWHVFQIGQSWAPDPEAALEEAERLAVLAMSLDPESAEAAAIYGHVASFLHKDFDSAAYYLGRSLELNPHQASAWALSAATQAYSGDPAEALRHLERYRSLAPCHPHDPILSQVFTTAYTLGGQFEKALAFGRRAVRAAPGFVNGYKPVLAALGHLGMRREAGSMLAALLRVEPDFNVAGFVSTYPFRRPEDREAYAQGLLLAGAPKE